MAISTSSLKQLIDAFSVMSEKDSITPTTVATVFYRLANLLADCATDSDISSVKNMVNGMGSAIAEEKTRAMNAESALSRSITSLSGTVTYNKDLMQRASQILQQNINAVVGDLAKEVLRAKAAEADLGSSILNETARAKKEEEYIRTNWGKDMQAEKLRAMEAEAELEDKIDKLKRARTSDRTALLQADKALQDAIDGISALLTKEISRAQSKESSLQTQLNNFSTAVDDEERRARKAEADIVALIGNNTHALQQEVERALNKEAIIDHAIDLLKRNLAVEETRAKNAETAIIAYMVSIINSQTPNGVNAGTTITVNIEDDPEAIWAILTNAPEKSVYQGLLGDLTFTMMHAATENTHILMWLSGDGVNIFTISKVENVIKTNLSRLSLFD